MTGTPRPVSTAASTSSEGIAAGSIDCLAFGIPAVSYGAEPPREEVAAESDAIDDVELIAELSRQTTPDLVARAVRIADLELRNLHAHGVELGASGWDFVADVLLQTRERTLSWDPARCTLLQHITSAVQSRGRQLRRMRGRQQSLDAMLERPSSSRANSAVARERATVERALTTQHGEADVRPDGEHEMKWALERFTEAMSKLVAARKDPDVDAAFQAWLCHHALGEKEVAEVTGMELGRATRAVRILRGLIRRLPATLRDDIQDLLT